MPPFFSQFEVPFWCCTRLSSINAMLEGTQYAIIGAQKKIVYHEDQENYTFNHYILPDMFLFNCQLKWILVIIVTIACREYIICKLLTPKYLRLMYAVQSCQRENIQAFIHYVYKEDKHCFIYGLSEALPKLNQGQSINMFQGISI